MHRHHLPSLSSLSHPSVTALIGSASPLAVIVCTGLGVAALGDVADPTVFPTRGQTVKVHAPWVKTGYTRQIGSLHSPSGGERTYIIPRADGDVILGGTREKGDWYPYPRPGTGREIIRRTLEICPELCPVTDPPLRTQEERLRAVEALVVNHLVGFRPSRKEGTRLERGPDLVLEGESSVVVYNYGHGGAGWQSSWGTAGDAVEVLLRSLGK